MCTRWFWDPELSRMHMHPQIQIPNAFPGKEWKISKKRILEFVGGSSDRLEYQIQESNWFYALFCKPQQLMKFSYGLNKNFINTNGILYFTFKIILLLHYLKIH